MRPAFARSVASAVLLGLAACGSDADQPMSPSLAKAPSGPTVTATNPAASVRDTTLVVQVLGSGFDNGSQVQFLLAGAADAKVVTNSVAFVSTSRLDATVTIAADATPALRDVAVTTAGGKKGIGTDKFQVLAVEQLPGGPGFALGVGGGLVVGRVGTACNGQLPALWNQAGVLTLLPLPPEGCSGWASAISRTGLIVGAVRTDPADAGRWSLARWTPGPGGYQAEFLGYWTDGSNIEPGDINASGDLVGTAYVPGSWVALWRSANGGWLQLPQPAGGTQCAAYAINDLGAIGGSCYLGGISSPVVWPNPTTVPVVLPRLANYNSHQRALGLNEAGDLVGYAWNRTKSGSIQEMATLWHFDGVAWRVQALGDLGGGTSSARGIDEDGTVVGWSYTAGNGSGRLSAFTWRPGTGMKALAGLGNESQALRIASDPVSGQVVVGGSNINGNWNPVRWRP